MCLQSPEMTQSTPTILLLAMIIILENAAAGDSYGPYKQVYPTTDLQQDPRKCSVSDNGTCPLYIALMIAFDGDATTSGVIPGIQVAINEINNDPSILPGYTLHYTLMATRVSQQFESCAITIGQKC